MLHENYVFSGFGYSSGKYKITNEQISDAIEKGFLKGFSKDKTLVSKNYQKYKLDNPDTNPFDYFAGKLMGFYERHHVTPFPPTAKKLYYSETSLDLCVKAVKNALINAKIQAKDIDAWFVSTVSPHEQAPGIAATVKSYFAPHSDLRPAYTLSSGCAGFNINLERAIEYFKTNPHAKNIIVAHTETMSSFLTQRVKFVPFVTFGDAAAAVILTKVEDTEKYGVINILNLHDLNMLDYVGVDNKRNLYMDDSLIKDRAIVNIPEASEKCLKNSNWKKTDIDYLVPHQTGNVILYAAAEKLEIPLNKVFLDGQNLFGNTSGATVPLSLALLNEQGKLKSNTKILCPTAGVGGNFGAFTYIHKTKKTTKENYYLYSDDLKNKNILVLGASGTIGLAVSKELKRRGAKIYLQGNKNTDKLDALKPEKVFKTDFNDEKSVENLITEIKVLNVDFDYLYKLSGCIDSDTSINVNYYAPIKIINSILPLIKNSIINLGSATEDIELVGFEAWTSSNRAFHAYLASASGEFFKNGIRTVYIMSGFAETGISEKIDDKYIFKFMLSVSQATRLKLDEILNILAKSSYLLKVLGVHYTYENAMLVGRTGYRLEVDI